MAGAHFSVGQSGRQSLGELRGVLRSVALLGCLAACSAGQEGATSGLAKPQVDPANMLDDGGTPPSRRDGSVVPPRPPDASDVCGDRLLQSGEGCDDGNNVAGDGCDAHCAVEPGYLCPVVGARCRAAKCGDGIIAADEECEDGADTPGDGCDARCRLEPGFACGAIGQACHRTVCGDGTTEGAEQCDDGPNDLPFDGCFQCEREPECGNSGCKARCGDGIKFPDEGCDDGNTRSGDGCSSNCELEVGFKCSETIEEPPPFADLPIVYRDFRGKDLAAIPMAKIAAGHVDFQNKTGSETSIVKAMLGADKKPVYAKLDGTSSTTQSAAMFDIWYRDDARYNRTVVDRVRLDRSMGGDYVFFDSSFFPLNTRGFVAEGNEQLRNGVADENNVTTHNFSFTSELRTWFAYEGGEFLEFKGDDDVWVFVNGRLAVDLGGVHGVETGHVTLDASGTDARFAITRGGIYELVVFQAERHTVASQYKLTLRDFLRARTSCESVCGDGVLTADEACDDGDNLGGYGQCAEGCVFGPRCGDGVIQAEHGETCDDMNRDDADSCSNQCQGVIIQ